MSARHGSDPFGRSVRDSVLSTDDRLMKWAVEIVEAVWLPRREIDGDQRGIQSISMNLGSQT